jgi:hypothetical protein
LVTDTEVVATIQDTDPNSPAANSSDDIIDVIAVTKNHDPDSHITANQLPAGAGQDNSDTTPDDPLPIVPVNN